jgi:hypothetical protein
MRLVVDANIFVLELIRKRGQGLISQERLELGQGDLASLKVGSGHKG